jgi:nucleoside-diphosphate-sugar epimerase
MNILVTGGSGFIVSHVAERLTKEGHEVTILDLMAVPPCLKNQNWHYFPLDVLSPDSEKLFANALFDVVIHLAFKRVSIHRTDDFIRSLRKLQRANEYSKLFKIHKVKRFIIVSSYEVYGDQKGPINENIPMKPVNQLAFLADC